MIVRNEPLLRLRITGVIDGEAAAVDGLVTFRPNQFTADPAAARSGILDGRPVRLAPVREGTSDLWTSRIVDLA